MQYCRIFQLDPDLPREEREWSFMGWDYAQKVFGQDAYICVYEYEADDRDDLEDIFALFNINRPDDFEGHSLSVSDIIELDDVPYYVDSVGFVELDDEYWDPDLA